ncbi:FGGY-family carbohydrate kinase [Sinomonas atrocyanea]
MTDGCTSQLAAGGVREGDSVGVLGTTLVLKTVSLLDRWDPRSGLYSHRAPDGRFWLGGASNVGGGSIRKPAGLDWAEIDRRARLSGPAQVVSYPLPRRGERFPIADPDFGGFTVDLAQAPAEAPADPVGAYRAALEGVAMVERLALDTLHVDPSVGSRILSGGATRSRLWNEIRAACLGTTVRLPQHSESGYGAAVLAAWGVLGGPFAEAAARFASRSTAFDPEPDLVAAMAERYTVFRGALAVEGATHPKAPTRQGIFNLDPTRREQPLAEEEEHQA